MKKRVVVTGMGVVSPIGNSLTEFRAGLKGGMSGKAVIRSFDISNFPVQYACEVKNFEARVFGTHLLDPFIQYAVAAATEGYLLGIPSLAVSLASRACAGLCCLRSAERRPDLVTPELAHRGQKLSASTK